MNQFILPALLALSVAPLAAGDEPKSQNQRQSPKSKLPLGKDTTFVTGPLDKEGYVDYEAALNERLRRGVTSETNAKVLIWKAVGPRPEGSRVSAEYFKWLGIDEPPEPGDYVVGIGKFLRETAKVEPENMEAILEQYSRAGMRPWAAPQYLLIVEWLRVNEKPLAVAIEATKRPGYFNPLVARENGPGALMGALLPSVQRCRELAGALTARAMLRVAEGKLDDAWQDLLACHRLGRLIARGGTLIEGLVGIAIDQIASRADLAYLDGAKLTTRQIQDRLKDLQNLPPMPTMADKVDLCERFEFLDMVQVIRKGGTGKVQDLLDGPAGDSTAEEKRAAELIDWAPGLRGVNRIFDRLAAALRQPDRAERVAELAKIEQEIKRRKSELDLDELPKLLKQNPPDKNAGKMIVDALVCNNLSAIGKVQSAYDRSAQTQRNLQVAFALAAYRGDTGRYPAKLEDLAPKYLAAVPNDLFSGEALIYKPREKGYLLYSVGINGKDDGGKLIGDDPPGDDIGVRMPLPPLK